MFFSFEFDFDIIEIGKDELAAASHALEPALGPEAEQALLGMRVQNAVTLFPAKLDGRIDDLAGQAVASALVADGQSSLAKSAK